MQHGTGATQALDVGKVERLLGLPAVGRMMVRLMPLALLATSSLGAACSLTQHWDEATLACDSNVVDGRTNFCLTGYSCFNPTTTCIADASRNLGQACTDARQCQTGDMCPEDNLAGTGIAQQDDVQTCLSPCTATSQNGGFYQVDGCRANYFCSPFLDRAASLSDAAVIGACVPTDGCTAGTVCTIHNQPGGICVPISDSASGCLPNCDITWPPTATYSDNCETGQYCQPVGLKGAQQLVCLDNTRNAQPNDAKCNIITAPCNQGSVCSPLGTCAPYCEIANNPIATTCGTNKVCCPFDDYGSDLKIRQTGFCATACP